MCKLTHKTDKFDNEFQTSFYWKLKLVFHKLDFECQKKCQLIFTDPYFLKETGEKIFNCLKTLDLMLKFFFHLMLTLHSSFYYPWALLLEKIFEVAKCGNFTTLRFDQNHFGQNIYTEKEVTHILVIQEDKRPLQKFSVFESSR